MCHLMIPVIALDGRRASHLKGPSVTGRDDCAGGFGHPMDHDSSVPSTWCLLPPGLVGSQLLNESQIQWSSAGIGTENCHAQNLMKFDVNCPSCSISEPSSRRQVPSQSEFLPEICSPMPDASCGALAEKCDEFHESRKVGTSGCAQDKPAGREEDSETSDENGPLPLPRSARAVPGQRHQRLRVHVMRRDGKSEDPLLERRSVRSFAARQNHQTALGKFLRKNVTVNDTLVPYSKKNALNWESLVRRFLLQ